MRRREGIIWRFRTRSAEFVVPVTRPKDPDYALSHAFIEWRHSLTRGTDLLSTALEKRYPDYVFKHHQLRPSKKLEAANELNNKRRQVQEVEAQMKQVKEAISAHNQKRAGNGGHGDSCAPQTWSAQKSRLTSPSKSGTAGGLVPQPQIGDVLMTPALGPATPLPPAAGSNIKTNGLEELEAKLKDLTRRKQEMVKDLNQRRRMLQVSFKGFSDADMAGVTKMDDFQSPIKPHDYVELRLNTMLNFYQGRIPKLSFNVRVIKVLLTLCTITTAVLSSMDDWISYVPIATTVSAALTSWASFSGRERRLEQYTETVRAIRDVIAWWDSKDEVEQASTSNISKLILTCEAIISTERSSELATALAESNDNNSKTDDQGKGLGQSTEHDKE